MHCCSLEPRLFLVSPQDLDLTWTDPGKAGEWVANARIPVNEPRTASVSFKRKFAFN